ncbi:MAG TPA: type II CAAX endopeptidase family protein [Pyrinomonadaceae bacterium]|nr:type II CAAX endopeptidase family protein [Pyrinomonadaceae bacterium]
MDTPQTPIPQHSYANFAPAPSASGVVDPDNPPWGLFGALGLLIVSFLLMVAAQVTFLLPYAVRRGIPFTPEAIAQFATKDPNALFVQVVAILPAHVLTLGLAWLIVTRGGKHPFLRTLGWEWGAGLTFWRCAGLAVLLLLVGMGIIWLTGKPDNALERLLESSRSAALATAFAATFTAPLVEEIMFRGLLYSALRRLVGTALAVAVVMLIFAAIHVPQYWPSYGVIATILLLSFVLTAIRARTGSLLPCFIIHLIFNGIQSVLIVLSPYIEQPTTPVAPPVTSLVLPVFELLARNSW